MELGDKNNDQIYYWEHLLLLTETVIHVTIEQHTPYLLEFSFAHIIQMYFGPIFVQKSSMAALLPVPTSATTEYPKSKQHEETHHIVELYVFRSFLCKECATYLCYSITRVHSSWNVCHCKVMYPTVRYLCFSNNLFFYHSVFPPVVQNLPRDTCRKVTDSKLSLSEESYKILC